MTSLMATVVQQSQHHGENASGSALHEVIVQRLIVRPTSSDSAMTHTNLAVVAAAAAAAGAAADHLLPMQLPASHPAQSLLLRRGLQQQ
jgi:hypothetical protein